MAKFHHTHVAELGNPCHTANCDAVHFHVFTATELAIHDKRLVEDALNNRDEWLARNRHLAQHTPTG